MSRIIRIFNPQALSTRVEKAIFINGKAKSIDYRPVIFLQKNNHLVSNKMNNNNFTIVKPKKQQNLSLKKMSQINLEINQNKLLSQQQIEFVDLQSKSKMIKLEKKMSNKNRRKINKHKRKLEQILNDNYNDNQKNRQSQIFTTNCCQLQQVQINNNSDLSEVTEKQQNKTSEINNIHQKNHRTEEKLGQNDKQQKIVELIKSNKRVFLHLIRQGKLFGNEH